MNNQNILSRFQNKGIQVYANDKETEFIAEVCFTSKDREQTLLRYTTLFCASEIEAVSNIMANINSSVEFEQICRIYRD